MSRGIAAARGNHRDRLGKLISRKIVLILSALVAHAVNRRARHQEGADAVYITRCGLESTRCIAHRLDRSQSAVGIDMCNQSSPCLTDMRLKFLPIEKAGIYTVRQCQLIKVATVY